VGNSLNAYVVLCFACPNRAMLAGGACRVTSVALHAAVSRPGNPSRFSPLELQPADIPHAPALLDSFLKVARRSGSNTPMTKTNRQAIVFSTSLIGLIVAGFAVQVFVWPGLGEFGMVPRSTRGLVGIFTMPFLHANFSHLLTNLSALVVLLGFVFAFHSKRMAKVVIGVILVGGVLLWLFGRPANHVGASGLIYGLAAFVVVSGIVQRRFFPVAGAIGVTVMYGSSLFWGLIPVHPGISWDGHLAGGLAGAFVGRKKGGRG